MCVHTLITVAHVQVRRQLTGIHSVLRHVGPEAQIISLGGKHLSLLDHPPPSPILPFHTLNHTESCHGVGGGGRLISPGGASTALVKWGS